MSAIPGHVHISEREPDGSWEDCTFDAGLEFIRDAIDSSIPATHTEAQAIRTASGKGPTGGGNLDDLRKGLSVRHHETLPAAISNKNVLTALKPGYCAVVQGSMSAFGPTHRLSVFDRNFDGGHAVYLARLLDGTLLWCDPEAPTSAAVPVVVSAAEVTAFVKAFNGEAIVGPIKTLISKEDFVSLKTYTPGYTADVKAGSNVRLAPHIGAERVHATTAPLPVLVVGTVEGDKDPANGSTVWYELFHEGRSEYTAKDNIVNLKAPAAQPDSQVAALSAQVNALTKQVEGIPASLQAAKDEQRAADKATLAALLD